MMRVAAVLVASLVAVGAAAATAPPIKVLPAGPVSTITVKSGELVSVALQKHTGKSWRQARNSHPAVAREVTEGDVGPTIVVVFRAAARGKTTIVYGLTRGESSTATATRTFVVTVR